MIPLSLQLARLLDCLLQFALVFGLFDESQLEKGRFEISYEFFRKKCPCLVPNKVHNVFHLSISRVMLIYLTHYGRPPCMATYFAPDQFLLLKL